MAESISIDIGGMTCDGCSGKVKKALESITGVISAEVSHESGVAVIAVSYTHLTLPTILLV